VIVRGEGSPIDPFALLHLTGVVCGYLDLEVDAALRQAHTGRHWLYVVEKGSCTVELTEQLREPVLLGIGDVLAIANDALHEIRQGNRRRVEPVRAGLSLRAAATPAPDGAATGVFVASVPVRSASLSELFPTLFHVPADGSRSNRRITDLVHLMEEEISSPAEAGAGAVVDHLADLVLIELLRVETHRVNETSPVWVQGIVDPEVARLVTRFHAQPAYHWNWESMGRTAGLSRSALDRRFRAVLGQSPKRYLLGLRMRLAAAALVEGRQSIGEIAAAVGYESEPAFHRAFRRTLGRTPGTYARRV
jgi:AraC-like DNA-binding protein